MAKLSTRPSRRADEQDEAPSREAVEAYIAVARQAAAARPDRDYGTPGRSGPRGRNSRMYHR